MLISSETQVAGNDLSYLINQMPAIITVYDKASGQCVYAGGAIQQILGYEPYSFEQGGLSFIQSLIHPDDTESVLKHFQKSQESVNVRKATIQHESIEYRLRKADGSWIWLLSKITPYAHAQNGEADDRHMLVLSNDISGPKHDQDDLLARSNELEAKLKQHSERLELALEGSKMGTWEWNVATGELIWSPEMMHIYGLDPDNDIITYEKFLGALHPDHREEKQKILAHALETGQPYQVEHRCIWPDGSVHWILGQGKAHTKDGVTYRMVGTAMNIDERKSIEFALEKSKLRYKAIFDSNTIGICIIDAEGKIHEVNDRFLNMLGYSRRAVEGKMLWDAITPLQYRKTDKAKLKSLLRSEEARPWEKEYIRKDGKRTPVLVGLVKIPGPEDLFVKFAIDTTQEHNLLQLNQAKDEFISLASHQLRTPATGVKQFLGMLLQGFVEELSSRHKDLLQLAYESNERQIQIIDDLLKVARVDAGRVSLDKENTDLVDMINGIIEEQRSNFSKRNQKIRLSASKEKIVAKVDKQKIRMVLENIIDNAGKYTYPNKTITITLRELKDSVIIKVADQGVGIPEADLGKIFNKFSRLNNKLSVAAGGTGLGLHWAKRIVDLHKGQIKIKSEVDKGSEFTVILPTRENV